MIEFGHSTHVGLRREHNEDTYYADAELGLWLVADGMGGHENGEVASALARTPSFSRSRRARPWRVRSRSRTRRSSAQQPPQPGPADGHHDRRDPIKDDEFEVAWVGDSRVYLWDGKLKQVSQDHSYVRELIEQGAISPEQARTHPHRNVVTQALGVTDPQSLRVETVAADHGRPADPAVQRWPDRGGRGRPHRSDPRPPRPHRAGMRGSPDPRRTRWRRVGQRHRDPAAPALRPPARYSPRARRESSMRRVRAGLSGAARRPSSASTMLLA